MFIQPGDPTVDRWWMMVFCPDPITHIVWTVFTTQDADVPCSHPVLRNISVTAFADIFIIRIKISPTLPPHPERVCCQCWNQVFQRQCGSYLFLKVWIFPVPGGRESVPPDASRCVKKCTDHTPKLKIDPEKLCVEDDPFLVDPFGIPQFLRGYLKLYGCIRLCVVIALCSLKQYLTYAISWYL